MTETAYQLNQDDLALRAHRLLEEWGRYQRREPGIDVGWPGSTVEARMMDQWGEAKRNTKESRKHWGRQRRKVTLEQPDGTTKTVAAIHMSPDSANTESRKGKRVPEPWPQHVQVVDKMIARMPAQLVRVTKTYYVWGCTIRQLADFERVSKAKAEQLLDRARFYFGAQMVLDPLLSGQETS